ncbi:hypothetical protein CDAR_499871 [Caerostris darwini]|uniref:Uncharacterized protein n=1 Tax=Caerostris darwini TaxID=1538125 RepID=A0AAV4VFI6_9ARAC|nr:hypothetical protein CDAR_499871 [Caerostris darwini]
MLLSGKKTVIDREEMAIFVTMEQHISVHLYNKMVLLSDSRTTIQAIETYESPSSKNILSADGQFNFVSILKKQSQKQPLQPVTEPVPQEDAGKLNKALFVLKEFTKNL